MQAVLFAPWRAASSFLVWLTLFIAFTSSCPAETCRIDKKATIKLHPTATLVTVLARINGTAVTMALDTGAQTLVTPETVSRLRLPRDYDRRTRSIGTTAVMLVNNVYIRDLEFAGAHFHEKSVATVAVTAKTGFGSLLFATPIAGLIGADLLSNYDLEFDFKDYKLALYRVSGCRSLKPPWAGDYTQSPIEITGTRRVAVPVEIDGVKLRAIFDTGANASAMNRSAALRAGLAAATLKTEPTTTVVGVGDKSASVPVHTFQKVVAAGLTQNAQRISILKVPTPEADMLLGQDFMRSNRIWVSYAARTMFVQPQSVSVPTPYVVAPTTLWHTSPDIRSLLTPALQAPPAVVQTPR